MRSVVASKVEATKEQATPTRKPESTTLRAVAAPSARFVRSVTRKANG